MKNKIIHFAMAVVMLMLPMTSCQDLFNDDDIKNNPNAVTDVDIPTLISGTLVGVALLHEDTDVRISALWSGSLSGLSRQHQGFAQYIVSSQTFSWTTLYPVASQARLIQSKADAVKDKWTKGVGQVLEALLIEKATDLYGDVPYSQAFDLVKYPTPVFDAQPQVYTELLTTLDNAIENLSAPSGLPFSDQDFIYGGKVSKWKEAAYTLKARLYLHLGQYANAIASAENGIQSPDNDALIPHGTAKGVDDNQNYDFFIFNRKGDTGFDGAFLPELMQSRINSANTKTNETALYNHYFAVGIVNPGSLDPNTVNGAFTIDAPHPLLTYYENQLIIAESYARLGSDDSNLGKAIDALNSVRESLADGYINGKTFGTTGRLYDDYILDDFVPGGIANPSASGRDKQKGLLYEIISQRYIILLMQYEAYNDVRRMAKATPVVQLPIKPVVGTAIANRYIYPQDEINSNPNTPKPVPDQWQKLPIFE
jgi:tetratricopeptide (TPR) repeat protein